MVRFKLVDPLPEAVEELLSMLLAGTVDFREVFLLTSDLFVTKRVFLAPRRRMDRLR